MERGPFRRRRRGRFPCAGRLAVHNWDGDRRLWHLRPRTRRFRAVRHGGTLQPIAWKRLRLKLLQLACGCRNERGDIAIQGRFAACLYARPARYGPSDAFHRDLWI